MAATLIILRLYNSAAFGLFAIAVSASSIATLLSTFRLEATIPVRAGLTGAARMTGALIFLAVIGALAQYTLLAAAGDSISRRLSIREDQQWLLFVIPLLGCTGALALTARAWLVRVGDFTAASRGQMARAALFLIVSTLGGLFLSGAGAAAAIVFAQVAGDLAVIGSAAYYTPYRLGRLFWPPRIRRLVQELVVNRHFLGAASMAFVTANITQAIPVFTIGLAFDSQTVGWFAGAQRIVMGPIQLIVTSVGSVLALRCARLAGDMAAIAHLLDGIMLGALVIGGVGIATAYALAPSVIPMFFGVAWTGAIPTFKAIIIIAFCASLYAIVESLPLLLRLGRFLVLLQGARLLATAMLALMASTLGIGYSSWLIAYVIIEAGFYLIFAATSWATPRRLVRATEKKA